MSPDGLEPANNLARDFFMDTLIDLLKKREEMP